MSFTKIISKAWCLQIFQLIQLNLESESNCLFLMIKSKLKYNKKKT